MKNVVWVTSVAVVLAVSAGCGDSGPEIATVTGHVTLDGNALPGAQILFVPDKGRPSVARADDNGDYELDYVDGLMGAIPGMCRVEITTYTPAGRDEKGELTPAVKEMVPAIYNQETTLQFDVKAKTANVANFDLDSKGKVAAPPTE